MGSSVTGSIKYRHSMENFETGVCKSLNYCHITHFCVLFTSLHTFETQISYGFWRIYTAECGMIYRKHEKWGSKFVTICYRI
jgi:hypothetical protein